MYSKAWLQYWALLLALYGHMGMSADVITESFFK